MKGLEITIYITIYSYNKY